MYNFRKRTLSAGIEASDHRIERVLNSKQKDWERTFYCIANQLYRQNKHTNVCPLCMEHKRSLHSNNVHPKSHIFPKSLLKEYRAIHCAVSDPEFIYDQYKNKQVSGKLLSYPLFCHKCESAASSEESLLRDLYLQIMSANSSQCLKFELKDAEKLKHILAIILFRGLLVGINFNEEKRNSYFKELMETLNQLRSFCCMTDPMGYKQSPMLKQLKIFVLPNCQYSNIYPLYILDLQLRNPLFTTVIKQKNSKGVYLYTKFDCFHCLLPLDCNCEESLDKYSFLSKTYGEYYVLHCGRKSLPPLLIDYNLQQIEHLIHTTITLKKLCTCLLLNPEEEIHSEPTPLSFTLTTEEVESASNIRPLNVTPTPSIKTLRETAVELSPIGNISPMGKASRKRQLEQEEHQLLKIKYQKLQNDYDGLKMEHDRLKEKVGSTALRY